LSGTWVTKKKEFDEIGTRFRSTSRSSAEELDPDWTDL
jgi:hypothetical protein